MKTVTVALPTDVWRSVERVLLDFQRYGPGELDSEYIPDEHLQKACEAINRSNSEPQPIDPRASRLQKATLP